MGDSYEYHRRLADFTDDVEQALAAGALDGLIAVRNRAGEYPMATALAEERFDLLVRRVHACDGCATVLVDCGGRVRVVYASKVATAPMESDGAQVADETVGAFMDRLGEGPASVVLSPPSGAHVRWRLGADLGIRHTSREKEGER